MRQSARPCIEALVDSHAAHVFAVPKASKVSMQAFKHGQHAETLPEALP